MSLQVTDLPKSFILHTPALALVSGLVILMIVANRFGFSLRASAIAKGNDGEGIGSAQGALLGLFGLMLAFTFQMSAGRYDTRREIVIKESNIIGTAVLRADLYPDSIRTAFRNDFRKYINSRIEFFAAGRDANRIQKSLNDAATISGDIWNRATALGKDPANLAATMQMIPALNEMIDIVTTRNAAAIAHVPDIIIWILFTLAVISSLIIGYSFDTSKKYDWITTALFSCFTAVVIYVILDLDRPRAGLINMRLTNEFIIQLKDMIP